MSHGRAVALVMGSLVGALVQSRVGVRSPPMSFWKRWRQIRYTAVGRRVVTFLVAHRAHAHAAASLGPTAATWLDIADRCLALSVVHLVLLHLLQVVQRRLRW